MKKKSDPRHKIRVETVKNLFSKTFNENLKLDGALQASLVLKHQKEIDKIISKNAPAWPLNQISPVDLATLRLAIWELIFKDKKEPYKVVIDEAVEIAKEYGAKTSAGFINGVLGTIVKSNESYKNHLK